MSISVYCDKCAGTFKVQDKRAGKKVYCKLCNEVVKVPKPFVVEEIPVAEESDDVVFASSDDHTIDGIDPFADLTPPPQSRVTPPPRKKPRRPSDDSALASSNDDDIHEIEAFADITPLPRTHAAPLSRKKSYRRSFRESSSWRPSRVVIGGMIVLGVIALLMVAAIFIPAIGFGLILFFMVTTGIISFAGLVLLLIGGIGLMISAFEEDTTCGLMYFFVPFYSLYYLVTRWNDTRYPRFVVFGFLALWSPLLAAIAMLPLISMQPEVLRPPGTDVGGPRMHQPAHAPANSGMPWVERNPNAALPPAAQQAFDKARAEMEQRRDAQGGAGRKSLSNEEALRVSQPLGDVALKPGDSVLIRWGPNWWHGQVVSVEPDGKIKVHYQDWPDSFDEAVITERIRLPNP